MGLDKVGMHHKFDSSFRLQTASLYTVVLVIFATSKSVKHKAEIKIHDFLGSCGQTTTLYRPICAVYTVMQIAHKLD